MYGGIDPSSGTACMLEIGKALGIKYKQGTFMSWTLVNLSTSFYENHYFDISCGHCDVYL